MVSPKRNRVQAFVEVAASNKLWLLATSLVLGALSFLGHFVTSTGDERRDDQLRLARLEAEFEELKTSQTAAEQSLEALSVTSEVFQAYNDTIANRHDMRLATFAWLDQASQALRKARSKVNVASGMLEGARLTDPLLEAYRPELVVNLASMDAGLNALEELYTGLRSCDSPHAALGLEHLVAEARRSEAQTARIVAAFHGWIAAMSTLLRRHEIERAAIDVRMRQHSTSTAFAVVGLVIVVLYIAAALRIILRPPKAKRR
jgi:hypothetical protein